ncbi:MAG TPA: acyl-CoA dehydrogenase family protein [Candidatus Dormibacteraeota bacterium]|nr:acyl-CoA dehydrogenase family protein [Candidatus Dormibacteraeota bacterium]
MDLTFSPEEETFRAEVRAWLAANVPPVEEFATLADEVRFLVGWQRRMAAAGWVGVHWPRAYGGRGATTTENYILQEELARAQAPEIIGRIGVNLVGPTLIHAGSEAQKTRHLPRILAADELWCQLFSEPNAGSDLSSLRCRAERDGDRFVVTGQKVWTSYAQFADWGILLARTDPASRGGKGISFLIVDMRSPGITVRPLTQMTGSDEFNEVFLEEVRVPAENLVGELHRGWAIAQTTLSHERGTSPRQLVVHRMLLADLLDLARQTGAVADPIIRQQLAQAIIEVEMTRLHNWRTLTRLRRGGTPGPESSLVKLFWSEMSQRLHDTAMQVLGVHGQHWPGEPRAVARGRWLRSYLYYRAATIFAGTSEVQRNIIAQRVLGLPRA